ncbi:major facilitator superfamily domain-containing protein [Xylogone sp. PMI_703]|nr:major facilitator superfamily domain-containing protein [Xylogone sp. PMI_703]
MEKFAEMREKEVDPAQRAEAKTDNGSDTEKSDGLQYESLRFPGIPAEDIVYTKAEERRLVRYLDFWILPVLMVSYGLQYWDKALLGQAVLFNLAKDLDLEQVIGHTNTGSPITDNTRYSNCSFIFYIGYLVATYPIAILTQRYPTAKVCAVCIFLWSIVMMSTAACRTYAELMVNRVFLGVTEACIAPTFTVYITFWWTRREQPLRSSLWYGMTGVGTMISPLISYGIGHIHGSFGASTWKYMYLIAGAVTCIFSFVFLWVLPDNPVKAKWLSDRERAIVLARLKENNAGFIERRFKKEQVREAVTDFNFWSNSFVVLITGIPSSIFASFSGLVIKDLGFTNFNALLLQIPLGFVALVSVFGSGYITRRWKDMRYIMMFICALPALAGGLICWLGPRSNPNALYGGVVLLPFVVGSNAIGVGLSSSNVAGHTKKSTVSAATFVGYCVGNMLGPVCFSSTPGPVYRGGFIACTVSIAAVMVVALISRIILARENARRDREFGPPDNSHALDDLSDRENMNFRYML